MSAIREEGAEAEPIRVLFTLHHNMNALDFVGPLEVLSSALHDVNDEGKSRSHSPSLPSKPAVSFAAPFHTTPSPYH